MTEKSPAEGQAQLLAGQAVYTWSTESIDGESGDGFVAVSPYLESKIGWLKRLPAETITQFAGGALISPELRSTYQPVGRYVDGSEAVLFRKVDAGGDAMGRPGRYIVHLIVGQREYLTLSSLYTIYSNYWINPFPVDYKPLLRDIPVESPRRYQVPSLGTEDVASIARWVHELVRVGSVELGDPRADEVLAILSCLPSWVDSNAVLTAVWSGAGATATLAARDRPSVVKGPDYRAVCGAPELQALQSRYAQLERTGGSPRPDRQAPGSRRKQHRGRPEAVPHETRQARRALRPASRNTTGLSAPPSQRAVEDMAAVIGRWQRTGSKRLSWHDDMIIRQSPADVLSIIRQSGTRLPDKVSRGQVDALAVGVLKACRNAEYWPTVRDCLPENRNAASRYVKAAPEPSVLLAAFFINLSEDRRFEILLDGALPKGTVSEILAVTRADDDLTRGLRESIRQSSYGHGCLLRGLLGASADGFDWIFSEVLPDSLDEEDLIPMVARYPELFVQWLLESESRYRSGLVDVLRQYARNDRRRRFRRWDSEPDILPWEALMRGH